jgi:hypothetical protein
VALFLPDAYYLLDVPDVYLALYTALLCLAWFPLVLDIAVLSLVTHKYVGGAIFSLDVLGTAMIALDLPIFPCPEFAECGSASPTTTFVSWEASEPSHFASSRLLRSVRFLRFYRLLRFQRFLGCVAS